LRGTTLVAPWAWSLVALATIAATEAAAGLWAEPKATWIAQARFAAAASTFCPLVALLGAKRPQSGPWQYVVLSLWVVLSLPSVEWLLFGGLREIHPARLTFLGILVALGLLCGLGTRFWPSSVLYAAGQLGLLAPFLGLAPRPASAPAPLLGFAAIVLAWLLLAVPWPPERKASAPLDRLWLDFRDALGTAWALRVAQRMNASAATYDWPVRLAWQGFVDSEGEHAADVPRAVEDSFRALLGRFVSSEWIDSRFQQATQDAGATEGSTASGR
jgi:hypothetical protein